MLSAGSDGMPIRLKLSGFTLFELLVVMTLITLVISLSIPQFAGVIKGSQIDAATDQIMSSLRLSRTLSIAENRPVNFYVNVEERHFQSDVDEDSITLSSDIQVRLHTARSLLNEEGGYIRFYPDGSSTGGGIELLLSDTDRHESIDIDWLTGRVILRDRDSKLFVGR